MVVRENAAGLRCGERVPSDRGHADPEGCGREHGGQVGAVSADLRVQEQPPAGHRDHPQLQDLPQRALERLVRHDRAQLRHQLQHQAAHQRLHDRDPPVLRLPDQRVGRAGVQRREDAPREEQEGRADRPVQLLREEALHQEVLQDHHQVE